MFIAMSHWTASKPLVSDTPSSLDTHQNSSCISHITPLSHTDPEDIIPLDQPLYKLQQVLDKVDAQVGPIVDLSGS